MSRFKSCVINISRKLHIGQAVRKKDVEFTSVRYPYLKRGNYAKLSNKNVQFFQQFLEPHQVLTEFSDLVRYNIDWMKSVRGKHN